MGQLQYQGYQLNLSVKCITPHNKLNISSVSIKKGYKINIENNIDKLKVVSERQFM